MSAWPLSYIDVGLAAADHAAVRNNNGNFHTKRITSRYVDLVGDTDTGTTYQPVPSKSYQVADLNNRTPMFDTGTGPLVRHDAGEGQVRRIPPRPKSNSRQPSKRPNKTLMLQLTS